MSKPFPIPSFNVQAIKSLKQRHGAYALTILRKTQEILWDGVGEVKRDLVGVAIQQYAVCFAMYYAKGIARKDLKPDECIKYDEAFLGLEDVVRQSLQGCLLYPDWISGQLGRTVQASEKRAVQQGRHEMLEQLIKELS